MTGPIFFNLPPKRPAWYSSSTIHSSDVFTITFMMRKTSNSNQFYNYYILFDVTGPYTSQTSMFSDFISSDDVQAADFAADIDLADFTA